MRLQTEISPDRIGWEGRESGVGFVVVESAFWAPRFSVQRPKTLILKGFGAISGKNLGRPKRRSNDHGSNARWGCVLGPLIGASEPSSRPQPQYWIKFLDPWMHDFKLQLSFFAYRWAFAYSLFRCSLRALPTVPSSLKSLHAWNQSRSLGRGCDEALFSEKIRVFSKRGEAIQWMRGLVRISTGKACSVKRVGPFTDRRTLNIEELLSSSPSLGILLLGGERGGGEPGICDGRMPVITGQTNTVPPKRCDTPCLAQGRPKLHNICMTVWCRSPDGQRHRTVMKKALRNRSPPSASPPIKTLKTLTSLNKEVRTFFLGDNSTWSIPSLSSLSDYSIWRPWGLF